MPEFLGGGLYGGGSLLYQAAPQAVVDLINGGTFARALEASYHDGSTSHLVWATSGQRVIEDRGDGGAVRVEPASTNQLLHSESLDNAAWTKTNVTVPTTNNVAPDDGADADTVRVTASSLGRIAQSSGLSAAPVTFSVWVKKGATSQTITISLTDGTNTATSSAITPTTTWTRYDITLNTVIAGVTARVDVGSTANDEVILWGAQAEARKFPTSYIRTTTATVTRPEDSLTYSTTPAALYQAARLDFNPICAATDVNDGALYDVISSGGLNDQIGVQNSNWFVLEGGVSQVNRTASWDRHVSLSLAWRSTQGGAVLQQLAGFAGGPATVYSSAQGTFVWTGSNTLRIGGRAGGSVLFAGRYRSLRRA